MSWRRLLAAGLPALIVVALLLAFATSAAIGQNVGNQAGRFNANLTGFQETPTLSSRGHGDFTVRLTSPTTLEYQLSYSELEGGSVLFAHIHLGERHIMGGVSAFLCGGGGKPACPASGTVTGTITPANVIGPVGQGIAAGEFDELIRAMRVRATYANVHTTQFPAGEIRGQIRAGDDPG